MNTNAYAVYQMAPFSMTLNHNTHFTVTPIFDAEYVVLYTLDTHLGIRWIIRSLEVVKKTF